MYVRSGFREFLVYNSWGTHIKTVYTAEDARDAEFQGYTVKVRYVDKV